MRDVLRLELRLQQSRQRRLCGPSLSGKRWPFLRRRSWVGNWCWEGYVATIQTATDFLIWLHRRDLFHCEGGWAELADVWDRPAPLAAGGSMVACMSDDPRWLDAAHE